MAGELTFNVISFIYLERGENSVTGDMHTTVPKRKLLSVVHNLFMKMVFHYL